MRWIESAGGPLLLLSEQNLGSWGGALELMSGPAAKASYSPGGKPTDYDRASSVEDFVGLIVVGTEQALVLGGEPLQTTWMPSQAGRGGMVVRWVFGESENEFLRWVDEIPGAAFRPHGTFLAQGPRLFLFDSAIVGRNVKSKPDEYLLVELEPGTYEIETAVYQPDVRTSMVVHRFEPSA